MLTRTRSLLVGLVAVTAVSLPLDSSLRASPQNEDKDKKDETGDSHKVFESIKESRAEITNAYSEELFTLAEECAAHGGGAIGEEICERIEALHTPPLSRRKTQGSSGVMAGAEEEAQGDGGELTLEPAVEKRGPTPAETNLAWIRGRLSMVREKYAGAQGGAEERALTRIETRRQRATERFVEEQKKLALKCVKRGFPAHAYELLLWTLQFDPENKGLRSKLLRQKPFEADGETRWYSAFELAKAEQGFLHHEEYGWVRPDDLVALKAGKLNFNGQWLPKAKVEELRTDWKNKWTYETEHYQIHTNAPLSDAVEFGREVEKLYAFFFRVFVDYYAVDGPADPELVFGGGMNLRGRKLVMNYYRSRESYLQACKEDPALASDPLLQQSAGFYDPNTGKAYFYREEQGPDLTTIYHEATHQIFGETSTDGREPPTWMVEGLAVFMEDPVVRGEQGAERLLAGSEPAPGLRPQQPRDINDFVKSTAIRDVFHGGDRRENYATAGAVVHFFLLYGGGKYRTGFIKYVQNAYRNAEPELPTKLSHLYEYCGVTKERLQEEWASFNKDPFPHLFDF